MNKLNPLDGLWVEVLISTAAVASASILANLGYLSYSILPLLGLLLVVYGYQRLRLKEQRLQLYQLWRLLDNIDTASDEFKPVAEEGTSTRDYLNAVHRWSVKRFECVDDQQADDLYNEFHRKHKHDKSFAVLSDTNDEKAWCYTPD